MQLLKGQRWVRADKEPDQFHFFCFLFLTKETYLLIPVYRNLLIPLRFLEFKNLKFLVKFKIFSKNLNKSALKVVVILASLRKITELVRWSWISRRSNSLWVIEDQKEEDMSEDHVAGQNHPVMWVLLQLCFEVTTSGAGPQLGLQTPGTKLESHLGKCTQVREKRCRMLYDAEKRYRMLYRVGDRCCSFFSRLWLVVSW